MSFFVGQFMPFRLPPKFGTLNWHNNSQLLALDTLENFGNQEPHNSICLHIIVENSGKPYNFCSFKLFQHILLTHQKIDKTNQEFRPVIHLYIRNQHRIVGSLHYHGWPAFFWRPLPWATSSLDGQMFICLAWFPILYHIFSKAWVL